MGGPFGTVLSALWDDDTHNVLLFARKTRGPIRGRAVGHPFGTVPSDLFDDDTHDALLLAQKNAVGQVLGAFGGTSRWEGMNINKREGRVKSNG